MSATMAKKKKPDEAQQTGKGSRHGPRSMVSIPPDLHRQLKKLADQNGRPLSWELRRLIIQHLEANGLWPPESETEA